MSFLLLIAIFTSFNLAIFGQVKKVEAFWGIGDLGVTIGDVPRILADLITEILKTAFVTVKKQAMNWLITRMQNAILGRGFTGSDMGFIQDWQQFMFDIADPAAGKLLSDVFNFNFCKLTDKLISPGLELAIKIRVGVGKTTNVSGKESRCTLTKIIQNTKDIWTKVTSNPWANFLYGIEPSNNEVGVYLETVSNVQALNNQKVSAKAAEGLAGGGYTSKKDEKTGLISVPGKTAGDTITEGFKSIYQNFVTAKDLRELVVAMATALMMRVFSEGFGQKSLKVGASGAQVQ